MDLHTHIEDERTRTDIAFRAARRSLVEAIASCIGEGIGGTSAPVASLNVAIEQLELAAKGVSEFREVPASKPNWQPHKPGLPRPCAGDVQVWVRRRDGVVLCPRKAGDFGWGPIPSTPRYEIVAWQYATPEESA